jgi:hypothetical protein
MKKEGRVAVAKYYPGKPLPQTPGFRNVLIHTAPTGEGGPLSPYVLRDEYGHLLENVWQFSKVYREVDAQRVPLSRYQPDTIVWQHGHEKHVDVLANGEETVTPAYWEWRLKGFRNAYAVRYPNGFNGRHKCLYCYWKGERLDYIAARKLIYCGEYARLAPRTAAFQHLRQLLADGVNLQLIEVDGPDPTLTYPPYDQISRAAPGMLMTEETVRLLLNDARKPFGHGFVIAALLLGIKME